LADAGVHADDLLLQVSSTAAQSEDPAALKGVWPYDRTSAFKGENGQRRQNGGEVSTQTVKHHE